VALVALFALVGGSACGSGTKTALDASPIVSPTATASPTALATLSPPATATEAFEQAPFRTMPPSLRSTLAPSVPGVSITISAVGDISLARELVPRMEASGAGYPYALVAHLITGDIAFANLEGALTDGGEPWPKGYNFRTPPRFATGLRDAGIDIVSLANNHTMDYGVAGLEDTLDTLDAIGVRRAGAGRDANEAMQAVMIESNGLRVAFIACAATPVEAGGFAIDQWAAGPSLPGVFVCNDARLAEQVAAARVSADFVIVTAHAGAEYRTTPDATQARIVNAVLEAGADAFLGHHAHVVQPVELRDGHLIAWGLGNFIFDLDSVDLANIPEPRVSLILNFTLTKGAGVTAWEVIPVVQDAEEDRPRPASAEEAAILHELLTP
jgi:poly-gamma-glutamate synthesis protein (capsule biosynthesis protein)